MLKKDKVIEYFHNNIKEILDQQSPYTWCDDDANRELLWEHEQDISDYNNDENEDKEFVSQHDYTLGEAEQAIEDIHNYLRKKWDLNLPFIKTSYVSTINDREDKLIFGWSISYNFETSIGKIGVSVKTYCSDIKVTITDNVIGSKDNIADDFDLFYELEQQLIMSTLKN